MLLNIEGLNISYGKNAEPTVRDVSLTLDKGEVLSIVGESGSGKTTVIRAILGCISGTGYVSAGKILFNDRDLVELPEKEFLELRGRDISMIFQDSGNMMNPVLTIGHQFVEYIMTHTHSIKTKAEARERAVTLLTRMNLPNPEHILDSYVFELSGGMRQRVGIAMALAFHPQLLLADEPTSALDVTTQAQIVEQLMRVVRKSQTAMIVVTHNIGVAAYMSDKLMVMSKGQVLEYGKTADIINSPQSDYTKKLLAAVPEIGGRRYV